jgi:GNAT superfamily N-acetyltransferase
MAAMKEQISNVDVWMVNRNLPSAPRHALPAGYHMRFYREGDAAAWVRVQQLAEQFLSPPPDEATFLKEYGSDHAYLAERIMFLVGPDGSDIGTITGWNDSVFENSEMGRIHWVAIIPSAQGAGLAKPLLSAACDLLRGHGYRAAWLWTGTGRVPALNLYLQFGFVPYPRDELEREAWRAVAPKLKYAIDV